MAITTNSRFSLSQTVLLPKIDAFLTQKINKLQNVTLKFEKFG